MTAQCSAVWPAVAFGVLATLCWPVDADADPPQVYDGMTKEQLAQFAERQGWQTEQGAGPSLTIRVGDQRVYILMLNCGEGGSCRSGLIQDMSYHFIKSAEGACGFWHWNIEAKGATGFGPSYVTLQRYLQFRGVTDQYLKDAIDAWLGAAPSFWALVDQCAQKNP
jgi:hypothetical protein